MKNNERNLAKIFWYWNAKCMRYNNGLLKDMTIEVDGEFFKIHLFGTKINMEDMLNNRTYNHDYIFLREICRPYRKVIEREIKLKEIFK